MKNKSQIAVAAALAVFGLTNVFLLKSLASTSARGQALESREASSGRAWEYCAVGKAAYVGSDKGGKGGLYWVSYFRESGVQVVEYEDLATEKSALAKAIAKLGADGWEMVGQGPLEIRPVGLTVLYFKRSVP